MAITGGCRCGQVRFTIDADPITTRACWCRDCQYWSGGNAMANLVFPKDAMRMTGELRDYASSADSGSHMHRSFCPDCGTPLFSEAEERPHVIVVRAGSLDDRELARPAQTIWTQSAPSWGLIDPDVPACPAQMPVVPER